jgi:hypothetical protein
MKNSLSGLAALEGLRPLLSAESSDEKVVPAVLPEILPPASPDVKVEVLPAAISLVEEPLVTPTPPQVPVLPEIKKPHGMLSVSEFCDLGLHALLPKILEEEKKPRSVWRPLVVFCKSQESGNDFDVLEIYGEHLRGWRSVLLLYIQTATGVYASFSKYIGKRFFWQDWNDNFRNFNPKNMSCSMPLPQDESKKYADMIAGLILLVQSAHAEEQKQKKLEKPRHVNNHRRRRGLYAKS